ncbi:hypothetical protein ACFVUH_21130 [Kitasatospora sp. NPDC058032]|uniref:hypothetical protein n=1 Tax=Kitasatospora sp. NPDC058032 TaxID=3346307 RepID=UPI0036DA2F93
MVIGAQELRADRYRRRNGFLALADMAVLAGTNVVLDPFSTLIALDAVIGEGPDPDLRGAVPKGAGLARGIRLEAGDVVNGLGGFATATIERRLAYHPRSK